MVTENKHIRKNKRTVCNIIAPDIQKPRDIIQAGKQMDIRAGIRHFPADARKL